MDASLCIIWNELLKGVYLVDNLAKFKGKVYLPKPKQFDSESFEV